MSSDKHMCQASWLNLKDVVVASTVCFNSSKVRCFLYAFPPKYRGICSEMCNFTLLFLSLLFFSFFFYILTFHQVFYLFFLSAYINEHLFNLVILVPFPGFSVIQFCATAFAYYAQATAAGEIFGHTLQSLRGIKYLYKSVGSNSCLYSYVHHLQMLTLFFTGIMCFKLVLLR